MFGEAEQIYTRGIFQIVTFIEPFPGVPIKVPVKPEICLCESWHKGSKSVL